MPPDKVDSLRKSIETVLLSVCNALGIPCYRRLDAMNVDWREVARLATEQMCAGVVHEGCRHFREAPSDFIGDLLRLRTKHEAEGAAQMGELERIAMLLNEVSIQPVVLKGPALILNHYKDPGLRVFGDLDILLSDNEIPAAIAVLEGTGYGFFSVRSYDNSLVPVGEEAMRYRKLRTHHLAPMYKHELVANRRLAIEIHQPRNFVGIDLQAMIDRSIRTELGKALITVLEPVDNLIYSCAHVFIHSDRFRPGRLCGVKLRHFIDIAVQLRDLPHNRTSAGALGLRAQQIGADSALYYGLYHAGRLFPGLLSGEILEGLEPRHPKRRIVGDKTQDVSLEGLLDDKWEFRGWSSTLVDRMFNPTEGLRVLERLKAEGKVGGCVLCLRAVQPPALDGTGGGFPDQPYQSINEDSVPDWQWFGTHTSFGNKPSSSRDLSAKFKCAWDGDRLYFTVSVADNCLVYHDQGGVSCDSLVLYCAPPHKDEPYRIVFNPGTSPASDVAKVFVSSGTTDGLVTSKTLQGGFASTRTEDGYVVDVAVAWESLDHTPKPGDEIGFDVEITDCDSPGDETKTILAWSGGRNLSWHHPVVYGRLVLCE